MEEPVPDPAPAPPGAPQTLQLRLHLQRAGAGRRWSAELTLPGAAGRLAFPDLDALARYLARLDRPPCGLR
jgi:hypothetical protein